MSDVIELNKRNSSNSTDEVRKLLVAHLQALRRYAYSLTKDMHDADELVQRVAEKLLKRGMPEGCEPIPWIFRVCKNTWIDELRSRNVRSTDADVTPESIASAPNDKPDKSLEQRDLQHAINGLQENYRSVIQLVVISGLSYAETASSLDIPIGTVMSRVARARQQLSQILCGSNND